MQLPSVETLSGELSSAAKSTARVLLGPSWLPVGILPCFLPISIDLILQSQSRGKEWGERGEGED